MSAARAWWPGVFGLCVFALALWAQPDALVGVFFDDGVFVVLAKALAEGEGYRNLHLPGAPAGVHYPPLYPLALSVLWRLWPAFPANVVLFRLFDSAALAVAAALVARHARRLALPPAVQPVALAVGFTAFPLLTIVGVRLSEPLFLAFAAGAVALADDERPTVSRVVAAFLLGAAATLTRSIGVAVIGGIALALWRRGRRREVAVGLAVAAAAIAPWVLWVALRAGELDPRLAANYGTYLAAARQSGWGAMLSGLDLRGLGPLLRLVLPPLPALLWYPLGAAVLVMPTVGALSAYRRVPALVVTLACYLLIVTLWPHTPDRFVWVVFPWIVLLGALGAVRVAAAGPAGRAAVAALLLVMAAGYLRVEAISLGARRFAATAERISHPFGLIMPSIAAELDGEAVVASDDEALVYLYAGRKAVPNYLFTWAAGGTTAPLADTAITTFLCDSGVTHVALTGPRAAAAPTVNALAAAGTVEPLFAIADGPALYQFRCPR